MRIGRVMGHYGLVRTIHLNMDTHARGVAPSRAGHSIGRWEGDTLVVDTVEFEPGILSADGRVPHSSERHVVERFTLDAGGRAVRRSFLATDPLYFKGEYRGVESVYVADVPYQPTRCDDQPFKSDGKRSSRRWILLGTTAVALAAGAFFWTSRKTKQRS